MNLRHSRWAFLATAAMLALTLALISAGCGGDDDDDDGGDTLTTEQYFARLQELADESNAAGDDINAELDKAIEEAQTPEELQDRFTETLRDGIDGQRAVFAAVEAMRPPEDVAELHDELAASQREQLRLIDEFFTSLADADPDEFVTLLEGGFDTADLDEADARSEEACDALQAAAGEADIEVDLQCGDD